MNATAPVAGSATYYDQQYNARASVADYEQYPRLYRELSDRAHASLERFKDLSYGPGENERLDIFPASRPSAPVMLFIHGGYWRALSKADSAFMAPALTEAGACVAVLDYDLAPAASLDAIVDQCRRALAWLYRNAADYGGDPERLYISGSSAGGHLCGMLQASGWHSAYGVPDDLIRGAIPVSGLFDLRPLLVTHINGWMGLDEASALRNSPLEHIPVSAGELVVAYGKLESTEFARQSRDYLAAWQARGLSGRLLSVSERNHYDIVLQLGEPGTPLFQAALELMSLN